ncbi:MAG: hypothetical protein H6713_40790 [Myxococcales bacterium]|nr:hypothetical protein [Myxococcales bacterium]
MSKTHMYLRTSLLVAVACLATAACQGAEDVTMCEDGTIERDGQCIPAALEVRLTHLDVRYDLSQPVYVNNRVPITFGITATSPDPANVATRNVAVSFSFVEADPADPENPFACGSSAIDVEVVGDGSEQLVDAFIWPTSMCAGLATTGAAVNIGVDFDGGDEIEAEAAEGAAGELLTDVDAPSVVFSAARRDEPLNQLCRSSLDGAELGCVYAVDLQPIPSGPGGALIDVRYNLSASSSVAVVPFQATENIGPDGPADPDPALVVQSSFVVNGRDPYISAVDPAEIPPALLEAEPNIAEELKFGLDEAALAAVTNLPGTAVVSYTIRAASEQGGALPLTIRDPADPANTIPEALIDEVLPGTANEVAHELFLEGAALTAVSPGGMWADESDFVVRGCFAAEFTQDGNKGDGPVDDCRELEVVLVHEAPPTSGAASLSFNKEFSRKLGSSRLAIESTMSTQNVLDLTGAASQIDGKVALTGKLGKSFELVLAQAHGEARLGVDPTETMYDAYVDAFGERIFSASDQAAKIVQSDDFSVAKSFTLANLGFGFGPVRIGFSIGAGGTLGFEAEDTLEALTDNASCQELLKSTDEFDLCGRMTRVTSPYFGLTGSVEGGLNLRIVKAAVAANLRFITTSFPLDTTLGWGLNFDGQLVVRGDVTWDMVLEPLAGDVFIIGKVGFRRFAKSLKVNLFSFSAGTIETNLLSLSMGEFEVLQ